jgi:hypothetical protein
MKRSWSIGFTLYGICFALTIALRWPSFDQSYRNFEWTTAHSQVILDNWLENGFWNERGLSIINPPSIEFPSLLSRQPYVSYPCGAQLPLFVLAKILGLPITFGFLQIWGLLWHGAIGLFFIAGLLVLGAARPEPECSLGAFLPGFFWLGGRGLLATFPEQWFADMAVLLPFLLVVFTEVIVAHALVGEHLRQWLARLLPVLVFWGMYTDWLFAPLCAVILLYRLLRRQAGSAVWPAFAWQIMLPAAGAIAIFLLQLFWVLGTGFLSALLERFILRSTLDTTEFTSNLDMFWIFYGYVINYAGYPAIIGAALALLLLCVRHSIILPPIKDCLFLLSVPSFVLLVIFRQHAAIHLFTALKFLLAIYLLIGCILPWAIDFPSKQRVVVLLASLLLLHEGFAYWSASDFTTTPGQEQQWEKAVRKTFGYHDVLFTFEATFETPAVPPMTIAISRKRIYLFDPDHVRQIRLIPTANVFLLGTAGAIEALCSEKKVLYASVYYCHL